jgi:peptidase E
MTKYILNSGGLRNNPEKEKKFMEEVLKGLENGPRILLCFFASGREYWEKKFVKYTDNFKKIIPKGIEASFELAFPGKFEEQISKSDTVIILGGDDYLLRYWLSQFKIPNIWKGKVVAGSSAGSTAICSHSWTCDWRSCIDGFGILNIKFIPHYKSNFGSDDPRGKIDWNRAYKELEVYGDKNMPIYALKEGDFIVFEK